MAENTEENASSSDQIDRNQSFGDVDERIPRLVRISSLHPNYVRQNLSLTVSPVKLLLEGDLMSMTKDWSQMEMEDERRLVRFKFKRETPTDYYITFEAVSKQEFTHEQPIISCIFWKEKNLHISTSVDIILILEYLVEQCFTIEEKNRIRRNLQSLKPYTVSRSNKSCQRFFNVLMSMEDPRPRNIEKDLKVFKWSDLFNAFNKVISKYSTNMPKNVSPLGDGGIAQDKSLPGDSDILGVNGAGISKGRSDDGLIASSKNSEMSSFLPNERLKILKRKVTQSRNLNQLSINGRHKLFQHAITPTDPIPIRHDNDKTNGDFKFDKENNFDSDNSENVGKNNTYNKNSDIRQSEDCYKQKVNPCLAEPEPKVKMQTSITGDELPDSLSSQSVSGLEVNSGLGSYSSMLVSISPASDSRNSNTKTNINNNSNSNSNTTNTNTNTNTTKSNEKSNESSSGHSSDVFTNGSSRSTQVSLDFLYTSSIGLDARKKVLSDQRLDHISKPLSNGQVQQESYFKERHHTHYFQYPSQSQLYNDTEYKPLSANNVRIHEEKTTNGKIDKVKLPSIKPSINKLNTLRERGIELPPLKQLGGGQFQFNGPLPGPSMIQSNIEEYRKQPIAVTPSTITQQVSSGTEGFVVNLNPITDLFRPPERQ